MDIKSTKKSIGLKKIILTILAIVVFLGLIGAAGYFYNENRKLKQDPTAVSKQETAKLVDTVGKLMTLPTNETPSVATVTDKAKLADQPFFSKSENGDKVLIYTNAKKAILFRPSTDKIIEVMPISFNESAASTTPTTAPATTAPATTPVKK